MSNTKLKILKLDYFSYLKAFFNLMKPRVMSLVIFTCAVGLLIAPIKINFFDAMFSIFAVALGSGAAGALNMWYESDLDSIMTRTCLRPIPTGKLTRNQALIFGILSSLISIFALYIFSNLIAATTLTVTILFYVFIYTIWLKRKTPQNIVIGGAAGALPPVIGWTIATNTINLEPVILFLIIFVWTPSHFWALSLYKSDDYRKAKIPMLPIISGVQKTKLNILVYAIILFPIAISPYLLKFSGLIYLIPAVILSSYYVFTSYKLFIEKDSFKEKKISTKLFAFSILYLFMIFTFILLDEVSKFF
jgi:heme o synthase